MGVTHIQSTIGAKYEVIILYYYFLLDFKLGCSKNTVLYLSSNSLWEKNLQES